MSNIEIAKDLGAGVYTKAEVDAAKAPIASPALTGTPTAPTPATGNRSTQIATMQKFADEFGASLSTNGYQKLPSGLIIQWGTGTTVPANGTSTTTFPIAFPNSCFYVTCIGQGYSQGIPEVVSKTTTSAVFGTGSNAQLTTPLFFAIGY